MIYFAWSQISKFSSIIIYIYFALFLFWYTSREVKSQNFLFFLTYILCALFYFNILRAKSNLKIFSLIYIYIIYILCALFLFWYTSREVKSQNFPIFIYIYIYYYNMLRALFFLIYFALFFKYTLREVQESSRSGVCFS